jgi:hypothetical protein
VAHYCVWSKNDEGADSYWVLAGTPREARRLVALNVKGAADAENIEKFECGLSNKKMPPAGFIHQRLNGPLAIVKR